MCLHSRVDQFIYLTSSFNLVATWGGPFSPQLFGEAGYYRDGMPGTSTYHTKFRYNSAQRYSDDVLEDMPCGMTRYNPNTTYWNLQAVNCQGFDLWNN